MAASRKRNKPGPARRRKVERSKHRRRCRDARRGTQLRRGAGRKLQGPRRQVPHRRRPDVYCTDAVHVTWRFLPRVWNLRSRRAFAVLSKALEAACERFGARLIAYSVQGNHIHMVWEADSDRALSRALNGLGARIGRGLNRMMGTSGRVLDGRYHAVPLRSGSQVRNVLQYLVENAERHARQAGQRILGAFQDAFTCLGRLHFGQHRPWEQRATGPPVVAEPQTHLLLYRWQLA